ncbi:MAG: hypothetical protein JOY78_19950 [Pseudonocardia sp.]|nr:hypothetical protein [Pseudonocardia sp.]
MLLTWGSVMDFDCIPTGVRVVPDLGDELLMVLDRLEALLGSVAVWEIEDGVGLPAPFADGKALGALQTVADVVRPTQGSGEPRVVSGRLPRRGWPGRRLPLHFVPIPDASLATLEHAVQVLAVQRGYRNLNAAVEQYTAVVGEPPLALVSCLSRTVSLLTLPWDEDVKRLWRSATAHPDKCDTELSRSEQQAYDRTVRRIYDLWSYRPGVVRPRS